jgi:hypothetical protein
LTAGSRLILPSPALAVAVIRLTWNRLLWKPSRVMMPARRLDDWQLDSSYPGSLAFFVGLKRVLEHLDQQLAVTLGYRA